MDELCHAPLDLTRALPRIAQLEWAADPGQNFRAHIMRTNHLLGVSGTPGKVVKVQVRPDPLAK